MSALEEKVVERQDHSPSVDYAEPSAPQLAEGTRRDIDLQPRKGICVATRCETVEQFVSTFHRWCEDSAIFICNARWPVGTNLPFSFELANEESVLVGLGKVTEAFTTAENRFGRAGIVVAVQKLKRESVVLFRRLLAARNAGEVDRHTPPPVFARATPAPSALDQVRRQLRPTKLPELKIPSPHERPIAKPRAKTVLGVPTIAKLPSKQAVMQIPTIVPRGDAKPSRAVRVPDATPVPVIQPRATSGDAVPHAIEDASHDTVRDEIPFALRNELQLLERAAVARRRVELDVDVDVGWDVEQPLSTAQLIALPTPAAVHEPTPEAILEPAPEAVPEAVVADDALHAIVADAVTADETVQRTPAVSDETPVASCDEGAAPLAISAFAGDAVTEPEDTTTRDDADELPIASSWWRSSLRWAARVAIASALFVTSAAITASIDGPQLPVATEPEAPAVLSTLPSAPSQTPTPAPYAAPDDRVAVSEPQEQPTAGVQEPAPAPEKKPAASAKKPSRPLAATRAGRPRASKGRCASLDCL